MTEVLMVFLVGVLEALLDTDGRRSRRPGRRRWWAPWTRYPQQLSKRPGGRARRTL